MTRIIAGAIGSLQLKSAAKATRPTSDRVKESLFARLDAMGVIEDSVVLDLFAGTGALGLECASRGAKSVHFIEQDRKAFELLLSNVQAAQASLIKQGFPSNLSAQNLDATKFLKATKATFDLVFLDPPYEFSTEAMNEILREATTLIKENGLVVIERSIRNLALEYPSYNIEQTRKYGDSVLQFLRRTRHLSD